jgi:Fe-S-cluster containining protein
MPSVSRPVVRSFKRRFAEEAAKWVRAGGHAVVWDGDRRARLVFREPKPGDEEDLGAWAVYDFGKRRWVVHEGGSFDGLASTIVPKNCLWIVERRAERDSVHETPRREVSFDCTKCAACCRENEVLLFEPDLDRFRRAGRDDLEKPPHAIRRKDGHLVLTLLPDGRCRQLDEKGRCGIYELRPAACSEFPMGSECCLYAREDAFQSYDGAPPE